MKLNLDIWNCRCAYSNGFKPYISIFLIGLCLMFSMKTKSQGYKKFSNCLILTEQAEQRIIIVNVTTGDVIWEWRALDSNIKPEHINWFNLPSDAKVVYNGEYVLMCASGGACALIRIKDKKTIFYVIGGLNPHSIEILPDGNIVCASSNDSKLTVFKIDTVNFPENILGKSFHNLFAHNVVWDRKRNLLWTASMNKIISYKYNYLCDDPILTPYDSLAFNDRSAHDLFPVPKEDALFLTAHNLWRYDLKTNKVNQIPSKFRNIKSASSESKGKTPVISVPKEQWWTDEIIDLEGNIIFRQKGYKIYKARWVVFNSFSYKLRDKFRICN